MLALVRHAERRTFVRAAVGRFPTEPVRSRNRPISSVHVSCACAGSAYVATVPSSGPEKGKASRSTRSGPVVIAAVLTRNARVLKQCGQHAAVDALHRRPLVLVEVLVVVPDK